MKKLTHVGRNGEARMVDVGSKPATHRVAVAEAVLRMKPATLKLLKSGRTSKGNPTEVARIAGINAAKQTSVLIPLCHPLSLTRIDIEFELRATGIRLTARVEAIDRTGVEMEALTAAAVSALTLYDMCKAVDRGMEILRIRLLEKSGGRSGHFVRRTGRKRK